MRGGALLQALTLGCLVVASVAALPETEEAVESTVEPHPSRGYHESVWIVDRIEPWIDILTAAAGWEVLYQGAADGRWTELWGLAEGVALEEVVLGNPGSDRGWARLVRISSPGDAGDDLPAPMMRPHARSWDTGGHFDVNLRAVDLDRRLVDLERRGFTAYSAPVEFTFGPFRVREVLAQGPDGIVLAMIERLEPTLESWPNLRRLSRLFNATQIVADFDRSFEFFTKTLGFQVYLEHHGASKDPGPNVLGLPHDLTTQIPRRVAILSPDGKNDGSVEILAFEGARGADFSASAVAPNRGIYSIRFPVRGLDGWLSTLRDRGVEVTGPITAELPPRGMVRAASIRCPEGAVLEFYEEIP